MKGRTTPELMVLLLTVMVCLAVLGIGVGIVILELNDPTTDTSLATQSLFGLISTILGALFGLLAARVGR